MVNKIPKIIHYCWFGKKDKPDIVNHCINSWKKVLDDYEIIEWNEDNFDVESNTYVKQAYESGKFAFVSDFVRIKALYDYGGIYLDTDVEVFKKFDDLLDNESFWGFEEKNFIATSTIGACKGNELIRRFLELYKGRNFLKEDGNMNILTNVFMVSNIVKEFGIRLNGSYQRVEGIATIYPQEYFSPYDYINCYSKGTKNTYTIHYYYKSWLPINVRIKTYIKKALAKIIGGKNIAKIRSLILGE